MRNVPLVIISIIILLLIFSCSDDISTVKTDLPLYIIENIEVRNNLENVGRNVKILITFNVANIGQIKQELIDKIRIYNETTPSFSFQADVMGYPQYNILFITILDELEIGKYCLEIENIESMSSNNSLPFSFDVDKILLQPIVNIKTGTYNFSPVLCVNGSRISDYVSSKILYTLDGTNPLDIPIENAVENLKIVLTTDTILKVISVMDNYKNSILYTYEYKIREEKIGKCKAVSTENSAFIALDEDSSIWTWGGAGSLMGLGHAIPVGKPAKTVLSNVTSLSTSTQLMMAKTTNNELFTWGPYSSGSESVSYYNATAKLNFNGDYSIHAADSFGYLQLNNGYVYKLDKNSSNTELLYTDARLIDGYYPDTIIIHYNGAVDRITKKYNSYTEKTNIAIDGNSISAISSNYFVFENGDVYYFDNTNTVFKESIADIKKVDAWSTMGETYYSNQTIFLKNNGTVWVKDLQKKMYQMFLDMEQTLPLRDIVDVACSGNTYIALDVNGFIYTWGENGNYGLGDGIHFTSSLPIIINK